MDKNIKRRWIRALKSGKYPQCTSELRNEDGYCCLGVLTDLYLKDHGQEWKPIDNYCFKFKPGLLKEYDLLPRSVAEWAGLGRTKDPQVTDARGEKTTLSSLNDNGVTFEEIAEIIKEEL